MKLKECWQDAMGNWTPEALRRMAMSEDRPNVVMAHSEEIRPKEDVRRES
jgi:hypothetical protein